MKATKRRRAAIALAAIVVVAVLFTKLVYRPFPSDRTPECLSFGNLQSLL